MSIMFGNASLSDSACGRVTFSRGDEMLGVDGAVVEAHALDITENYVSCNGVFLKFETILVPCLLF